METKERLWANDASRAAVEARLAYFCEITGTEPPKLSYHKGELLGTEGFFEWCKREGVSIDWIITGELRPLITCFRKGRQGEETIRKYTEVLDDDEMRMFGAALKACVNGLIPIDQAIAGFDAALCEHRGDMREPYEPKAEGAA